MSVRVSAVEIKDFPDIGEKLGGTWDSYVMSTRPAEPFIEQYTVTEVAVPLPALAHLTI